MNSKIKFLFLFLLMTLGSLSSFCQGSNNPFDIKNRTQKELISSDSPDSIFLLPVSDPIESNEILSESNPFDVSHVPIQKEKLRKKTKERKQAKSKTTTATPLKNPSSVFDFKFWILLLSVIIFAVIFTLNRAKITSLQRAVLNQNFQKSLARENSNGNNLFFLLLYLLFLLNLALLFYNYIEYNERVLSLNFKIFAYITLIVTGIYAGKHLFLGLIGFIFPVHKEMNIYSFTVKLFNSILGLLLLVINVLLVLGPENWKYFLLLGAFMILALFYLFRLFNGTIHASRLASKHTFHFFLYLCVTEIAPLVIFYKLLN